MNRCPHAEDAFPECEPCNIRRLEGELREARDGEEARITAINELHLLLAAAKAERNNMMTKNLLMLGERDEAQRQLAEAREGMSLLARERTSFCDERNVLDEALAQVKSDARSARGEVAQLRAIATDGIATGLSRALVALEARAKELALRDDLRAGETASCAKLVRGLLEALVDGPTDPGEKLAQR